MLAVVVSLALAGACSSPRTRAELPRRDSPAAAAQEGGGRSDILRLERVVPPVGSKQTITHLLSTPRREDGPHPPRAHAHGETGSRYPLNAGTVLLSALGDGTATFVIELDLVLRRPEEVMSGATNGRGGRRARSER